MMAIIDILIYVFFCKRVKKGVLWEREKSQTFVANQKNCKQWLIQVRHSRDSISDTKPNQKIVNPQTY